MIISSSGRAIIVIGTAVGALLFGMALAARTTPTGKPLVRHVTLVESLSRGSFAFPSNLNVSFLGLLSDPHILVRGFTPATTVLATSSVTLAKPIMAQGAQRGSDVAKSE